MANLIFRWSRAAIYGFAKHARARRMRMFQQRVQLRPGTRILDLGGTPALWDHVAERLDITILNLPGGTRDDMPTHHAMHFLEGDACDLGTLADKSFDVVFSNSVIEHVGDAPRQDAFAREARRVGKRYWIQTPSPWFPIEAHTGMPYWWLYPESVRAYFIRRWRRKLPEWTEYIAGTRVLSHTRMRELFPGAQEYVESVAGIPKSYVAYLP